MHSKSTVVILKFMKSRHSGFTLVELLITVAVAAVLASLAVPSFRTLLLKRSVQSAADTLVSDMRFARAEALKRSARVTICASSNGTSCAGAGGQWSSGWMVFVPSAANGNFTAGDEIVRVQDALPSIASIADAGGASLPQFIYEPTGWAKAATQTFIVTPAGSVPAGVVRVICVSMQGRAGIRAMGSAGC